MDTEIATRMLHRLAGPAAVRVGHGRLHRGQTRSEPSTRRWRCRRRACSGMIRLLAHGTRSDRLVRFGLWIIAALAVAFGWAWSLSSYSVGVDLEIPLRAAERWAAGGQPYLGSAFTNLAGSSQPFMYPPYALPFLAPLTLLPRAVVLVPWLGLLLAVAFATCRMLGVPVRWIPAILVWPPFAEPLIGGNVQVLLFAAFVALYWSRSGGGVGRDIADEAEPSWRVGLKAGAIMFLKVGQFQPWLHVGRWRWKAAALAVAMAGAIAAVTLPLVGLDSWRDWLQQVLRATNSEWRLGGFALPRLLLGAGLAVSAAACLGVLFVPAKDAGRAVGILTVIGAPSLYVFGCSSSSPRCFTSGARLRSSPRASWRRTRMREPGLPLRSWRSRRRRRCGRRLSASRTARGGRSARRLIVLRAVSARCGRPRKSGCTAGAGKQRALGYAWVRGRATRRCRNGVRKRSQATRRPRRSPGCIREPCLSDQTMGTTAIR